MPRRLRGSSESQRVSDSDKLARIAIARLTAVLLAVATLLTVPPANASATPPEKVQVRQAWDAFHSVYAHRAARSLCGMLAAGARNQLEAQVGRKRCAAAATAWFASVEYDHRAAIQARLLSVQVEGRDAMTVDSDPNSPASGWVIESGRWKLDSFLLLG